MRRPTSEWPGTLQSVLYKRPMFATLVTGIGADAVTYWLLGGLLGTFATMALLTATDDRSEDHKPSGAANGSRAD